MRRLLLAVALLLPGCAAEAAEPPPAVWRAAVVQPMDMRTAELVDVTCEQVLRVTASGARIRVRLSNVRSPKPLVLSAVTAGVRGRPSRPVTVGGKTAVVVPAGSEVDSDPVLLPVVAGDDVQVVFTVSGRAQLTAHRFAAVEGSCTSAGVETVFRQGLVVEQVEVEGAAGPGIVATGDSLTDAPLPPGAGPRWTQVVAEQLPGRPVVNAAIAGNRVVLGRGYGAPLAQRFDHDVLARRGVGTVVLLAGTNDISMGISAARLQRELTALVVRARAAGLRVVLVTIPPATRRSAADAVVRKTVNAWIRTGGVADQVVDADALLRDPSGAERLGASYDVGDGLHLSPAGHRALGDLVARTLSP